MTIHRAGTLCCLAAIFILGCASEIKSVPVDMTSIAFGNKNQRFLDELTHWIQPQNVKERFLDDIAAFSSDEKHTQLAGSSTQSLLQTIKVNDAGDGLMVLCVDTLYRDRCYTPGWPNDVIDLVSRKYRITIFETATSRPVWGFTGIETGLYKLGEPWSLTKRSDQEYLFGDLDSAIPKILTH